MQIAGWDDVPGRKQGAMEVGRQSGNLGEMRRLLRMEKDIDPSKERLAEMLLALGRRHDLLSGRRQPLRVLAEMADIAPHRLEEILSSDVKPRPQTFDKLARVKGAPSAAEWAQAALGIPDAVPPGPVSDADRALLDAMAGWPDEEKYRFAESIRRIQELAREDRGHA